MNLSSIDTASLIFIFGVAVLIIYLQVLLVRWALRINEQIRIQKAQLDMLVKLCEKQGVPVEELNVIMYTHGMAK